MYPSKPPPRIASVELTLYAADVADVQVDRDTVNAFVKRTHRHAYDQDCGVLRNAEGKPALTDKAGMRLSRGCSISHTRHWLMCAFHDACTVGIDVERPRDIDLVKTGTWFFGETLGKSLAALAPVDRERLFFRAWTAYEALYKCGLRKRREMPAVLDSPTDRSRSYEVRWLIGPDDHYVCIATHGNPPTGIAGVRVMRETATDFVVDHTWQADR